jgi:hypothetical protein
MYVKRTDAVLVCYETNRHSEEQLQQLLPDIHDKCGGRPIFAVAVETSESSAADMQYVSSLADTLQQEWGIIYLGKCKLAVGSEKSPSLVQAFLTIGKSVHKSRKVQEMKAEQQADVQQHKQQKRSSRIRDFVFRRHP